MKIDAGFQRSSRRFDCVCYGLRIGEWFGVELIRKYLTMRGIGAYDDLLGMFFFFFLNRKRRLEMVAETNSKEDFCFFKIKESGNVYFLFISFI